MSELYKSDFSEICDNFSEYSADPLSSGNFGKNCADGFEFLSPPYLLQEKGLEI
jgi:hypothetical protein